MRVPDAPTATLRSLSEMEEFRAAVAFQESIWGDGFSERVPRSLMKVTRRLGGVVAGAFDGQGRMVGFVYGMTGPETGAREGSGDPLPGGGVVVHWSDILAVAPGWRNRGLGRQLKLFQRERLLEQGVTRMYWSYDPLESRNGWLNLVRLGAEAVEYVPDMYGRSDSPLHRGLGTDRFVVRWELDSPRVHRALAGPGGGGHQPRAGGRSQSEAGDGLPWAFAVDETGDDPRPVPEPGPPAATGSPGGGPVLVPIPADIQRLRDRDPELAGRWRSATREALAPRLDAGWRVSHLIRRAGVSLYRVQPPSSTQENRV